MVERLRKVKLAVMWTIVLALPLLAGFVVVFFSLQHVGLAVNFRPWLVALVVLLIFAAIADARRHKRLAQGEEARNV